jgi:hypothetical protein
VDRFVLVGRRNGSRFSVLFSDERETGRGNETGLGILVLLKGVFVISGIYIFNFF